MIRPIKNQVLQLFRGIVPTAFAPATLQTIAPRAVIATQQSSSGQQSAYAPALRMAAATRPRVTILMPVYNTPSGILDESIKSVLGQTCPAWELCICDDYSESHDTVQILRRYRGADPRIKITRSPRNLHIAKTTNLAAEFATGEFVAFLDHDDTLEPDAVEIIAQTADRNPEADVLYTDEDKIELDGSRSEPYLKPDWSPEHLLSVMYVLHFLVVRKSLFLELGGLRPEYSGSQDYDLALRATAKARKVLHIPRVLYHWRKVPGSAAAVVDAKPAALVNARRALTDFVKHKMPEAEIVDGLYTGSYRVKWPVDTNRPVSLIILTASRRRDIEGRGDILLVENAVDSIINRSSFRNYRILVLDDGKLPSDIRDRFEKADVKVKDYRPELPFNYSKKMNYAFTLVDTEDVIMLNDDIEVIASDWIEALLAFSRQPEIGAVGAMLLHPNDRIQHAGVALGVNGTATHIFYNQAADEVGYCGFTHVIRNYSAVTGAVLATRMNVIRQAGRFDPNMTVDYNDIDFCLRVRSAGYRIVYTPYAKLYHFEGSSLTRAEANSSDQAFFLKRWGDRLASDPYYNPGRPGDRWTVAGLRDGVVPQFSRALESVRLQGENIIS